MKFLRIAPWLAAFLGALNIPEVLYGHSNHTIRG